MPRRNRVTPTGALIATPARGAWMGNRGVLHDDAGNIVRESAGRLWICCRLEFRGRRRRVMTPGRYTELFFLDEATALAAGHRPCGECRRRDYLRFKEAFAGAQGLSAGMFTAAEMDRLLHDSRVEGRGRSRRKVVVRRTFAELPEGAMFLEPDGETPLLKWRGRCRAWSPEGYRTAAPLPAGSPVRMLTPAAIAAAMEEGYVPQVHRSAGGE